MWLSAEERVTLSAVGLLALMGLSVLAWQRQRPLLVIEQMPAVSQMAESLDSASRPRSPTHLSLEPGQAGLRSVGRSHGAAWDDALSRARHIDVNTATAAELERLPGIGPALAARIVAYREAHGVFASVDELERVQGMGPRTVEQIRDYVVNGEP